MHTRRVVSIIDITALCYISFYVSAFHHAARLSVSNVRLCFVYSYVFQLYNSVNVRAVVPSVHDTQSAVIICKTPWMFHELSDERSCHSLKPLLSLGYLHPGKRLSHKFLNTQLATR